MTLWARLTWQAADPGGLAADLAHRLGIEARPPSPPEPAPFVEGARRLALSAAIVDVVPWRHEGPADPPQAAGRLVFEPVLAGDPEPDPAVGASALVLAGVGWATVELDRAESELAEWLVGAPRDPGADGVEPHLGARARPRRASGLPGGIIVLLEPTTEGRLAASLARDGEGPCALYLWPPAGIDAWIEAARARGVPIGTRQAGPFGGSVLVAGGPAPIPGSPAAGPHLLVVERKDPVGSQAAMEPRDAGPPVTGPGTIGP